MSLVLFALYLIILMSGCEAAGGQCKPSKKSTNGKALKGHTFKEVAVKAPIECQNLCESDHRCHSYNFYIPGMVCEMNSETKETKPYDFVTDDQTRFYMKREDDDECMASPSVCDTNANCENTVGSYICSCKVGFSGDGKTCTDVDECTASSPVCDVNANCTNTRGSYFCTCKSGFSGDGKTCKDIDECTQGSHDCFPSFASCMNSAGSYNCTCNHGYVGDGRTSCQPEECQDYESLSSADRKVTYGRGSKCDSNISHGWFRFEGEAGTRMPNSCPPYHRCGTDVTGWMNGEHPTVADGKVNRQVCFHGWSKCCHFSTNIQVRNCGSYYAYYLSRAPRCNLRYCGSD